jgi:CspA family cold shock protein
MMNDSFGGESRPGQPVVINATVKWFNTRKGFGFLTTGDGADDVFVHVSTLEAAGISDIAEGMPVRCEVVRGPKGLQVSRMLEINGAPAAAGPLPRPRPMQAGGGWRDRDSERGNGPMPVTEAVEMEGTVKWYNGEKGFGFVIPADGGKDVFVHMSVLKRSGLPALLTDQPVRMMVVTTSKGREAKQIWLL